MKKMNTKPEMAFAPFEEDLNLYLDGELPYSKQAALFAHLSQDEGLRSQMEAIMIFRRMSRQEQIVLPSAADDRFLKRLAKVKEDHQQIDRTQDRQPLWKAHRPVSVRFAITAIAAVFLIGVLLPITGSKSSTVFIAQEEEQVMFDRAELRILQSYIYVFEPGLVIEADQSAVGIPTSN